MKNYSDCWFTWINIKQVKSVNILNFVVKMKIVYTRVYISPRMASGINNNNITTVKKATTISKNN